MTGLENKTLPNTGSIARDILATERTFLAWARTGLGFVGAGSAMFAAYHRNVLQENSPEAPSASKESLPVDLRMEIVWPSGILIGNGAFLLLFATRRYVRVVKALQSDRFPLDTRGTLSAVCVTAIGTLSSLALIIKAELEDSTRDSSQDASKTEKTQ